MTRGARIERAELFEADAGWQRLSFLKLTAADGTTGWAEFSQHFAAGLAGVVQALAATAVGWDAREAQRLALDLQARGRAVGGGLHAQACAAVENACLDLKARLLGVPVYELFGGSHRSELPAYWSHCGLYRICRPDLFAGACVPRSLDDMRRVAAEVPARGFRALKRQSPVAQPSMSAFLAAHATLAIGPPAVRKQMRAGLERFLSVGKHVFAVLRHHLEMLGVPILTGRHGIGKRTRRR